jgi:hypothetical protein
MILPGRTEEKKTKEPQNSRWPTQFFGTKCHKLTYDWFAPRTIEHSNLPPNPLQSGPDRLYGPCIFLFKLHRELYPGERVARDCGLSFTASKAEFSSEWSYTCDRECAFMS